MALKVTHDIKFLFKNFYYVLKSFEILPNPLLPFVVLGKIKRRGAFS